MKLKINTISFFRETMRSQKWMVLVVSLLTFIVYPVQFLFNLTQWESYAEDVSKLAVRVATYLTPNDFVYGFTTVGSTMIDLSILVGVVSGILAFAYLQNKRQVALYHGLPISREKLLFTKLGVYSIIYFAPLFVSNVLLVMILMIRGYATWLFMTQLAVIFFYNVMMFWCGYFLAAIAMLVTGKVFLGVLGTVVFVGYFPVIKFIIYMLVYSSFNTFVSYKWNWLDILERISPVTFMELVEWNQPIYMVITVIVVLLLGGIHLLLMKKRPSEAAGRSMVYPKAGIVIQFLLLFASTIGMALFGYSSSYEQELWLVLGGILGLFIGYVVLQLLYGVEFKKLLGGKWMIVIVGIFSFLVIFSIHYDWFRCDSYLPDYDEIVDINIEFTEGDQYSTALIEEGQYTAHMGVDEKTYELMELIIESSARSYDENGSFYSPDVVHLYVEYRLENGMVLTRVYQPYVADIQDEVKVLWGNEEFLNVLYPIRMQDPSMASSIYLSRDQYYTGGVEDAIFYDNKELQDGFMEAYKQDALEINASTLDEAPIGMLYYRLQGKTYNDYYNVYIYPSFTNTLAYLEANDVELPEYPDIDEVEVIYVYDIIEAVEGESEESEVLEEKLTYNDRGSIEVLLDDIVWSEFQTMFVNIEESRYSEVILKDGSEERYYFIEW